MKTFFLIFFLAITFCSCTINKKISYKTSNIDSKMEIILSKYSLDIEDFADKRFENTEFNYLKTTTRQEIIEGKNSCVNAELHYKKEPVAKQISNLFIKHLSKLNSYKKIYHHQIDSADLYLTAELTQFYGKQGFSTAALVGAQFGLIGALATAGAETNGYIVIELSNIKIFNKKHQLVSEIGSFKREYEGKFKADAYCWCIYDNMNAKLKEFNTELIYRINSEISNVELN